MIVNQLIIKLKDTIVMDNTLCITVYNNIGNDQ